MSSATSPGDAAPRAISTRRRCSSMRQAARHKANATWVQVGDGSHLELHHTPWWRHIYRDFRRYGVAGSGDNRGAPGIGNRVFIGAHSIIVGRITVGDDAVICAGSVVTRSVPARAMVMGNPARVVSYDGSFDYIFYDGMDADPARK